MKKYLVSASLAILLASGLTSGSGYTASANSNIEINVTNTWTLYYTDYTYTEGWYAKWYINHSTGQKKKVTHRANGSIYSINYY